MAKTKQKAIRFVTYTLVILGAFWVAYLLGVNRAEVEKARQMQTLKREIDSQWGLVKIEIDAMNEAVQNFVERNGLKPGEPLSLKTLSEESPIVKDILKGMKTFWYVQTFPASSGPYSTKATAIVTLTNIVPKEGERFAYGAVEHNYEIFGSVYSIYPQDDFAIKRIKRALQSYSKTIK